MNERSPAKSAPRPLVIKVLLAIFLAIGLYVAASVAAFLYALGIMAFYKSEPVRNPAVNFNSARKQGFEIGVKSLDGMGSIVVGAAKARYSIQNNRICVPAKKTIERGNVYEKFEVESTLRISRQDAGHTLLIAYDDQYQDSDFYGLGVCDYAVESILAEVTSVPSVGPIRRFSLWISRKNFVKMRSAPMTFYCDKQIIEHASCVDADTYAKMLPRVAEKRQATLVLQAKPLDASD